jgi:sugar phosphate permease
MTTELASTTAADDVSSSNERPTPQADRGKRVAVFVLTWCAYAAYYFGRKGFSVVKSTLQDRMGMSVGTLGAIDTVYLAAYALGQFVHGNVGDRIGSRRLIGFGMLAVAGICALLGFSTATWIFIIAYTLNGFFQATGWPGTVKAMGEWFTARERGTVMGFWATCYQAGGLMATAFATFLFIHHGWRWAFFGPAMLIATVGLVNLFFLPERAPEQRPTAPPGPDAEAVNDAAPAQLVAPAPFDVEATHSEASILRSPVLWSLGTAYFWVKLIRYSILFWLPYYLNVVLHYSKAQAGYQSVSFEVGGILGAIVVGFLSDRYFPGRRRTIAAIMLALLAGALLLYTHLAPISATLNFIGMAIVGFCLFGPDTIIAGAAAQDLGGKRDVAKAAGFIDGLGSIGAILQGVVTSTISQKLGWDYLFYAFVAMAVFACIALCIGHRPARSS